MKVIKCGFAGFFDVYQGEGWTNWTRVQLRKGSDHLHHVNGVALKGLDMLRIRKEILG